MRCPPALALATALALVLPACDSAGTAAADAAAPASASATAAAAAAETSRPSSTAPLPSDPVEACIEGMRREISGDGTPDREARVAKACAAIYKNPVCRDAHERYDSVKLEDRAMILTERCRVGYCPTLPEPKPRFCAEEMPAPEAISSMWFELRIAIWKLDHGEETARKLEREHLRVAAQVRKLTREAEGGRQ